LSDINLGIECEEYLKELMKEGHADIIANIRENCLQFYVTAAEEISKRLPIKDKLSKLKVFQSNIALYRIDRETSFNDVSFVAHPRWFRRKCFKKRMVHFTSRFYSSRKRTFFKIKLMRCGKKFLNVNIPI